MPPFRVDIRSSFCSRGDRIQVIKKQDKFLWVCPTEALIPTSEYGRQLPPRELELGDLGIKSDDLPPQEISYWRATCDSGTVVAEDGCQLTQAKSCTLGGREPA